MVFLIGYPTFSITSNMKDISRNVVDGMYLHFTNIEQFTFQSV